MYHHQNISQNNTPTKTTGHRKLFTISSIDTPGKHTCLANILFTNLSYWAPNGRQQLIKNKLKLKYGSENKDIAGQ